MSEELTRWDHLAQIAYSIDGEPMQEVLRGLRAIHERFKNTEPRADYPAYGVGRLVSVLIGALEADRTAEREEIVRRIRASIEGEP